MQAVNHIMLEFTRAQCRYHDELVAVLKTTIGYTDSDDNEDTDNPFNGGLIAQTILSNLASSLTAVSQKLSQLSIVPVSLSTSFSVRQLTKLENSIVKPYVSLEVMSGPVKHTSKTTEPVSSKVSMICLCTILFT